MSLVSSNTFKVLALKAIKSIGPATIKEVERFLNLEPKEMVSLISRKFPKVNPETYSHGEDFARQQVATAERLGHKIISFIDPEYPKCLLHLSNTPIVLYVKGSVEVLNSKTVAVIGTRNPTIHGEIIAARVTNWLSKNHWCIVSGLALGVDTIAHKSSIASGGKTVAVLAHGLDSIYPKKNSNLAEEIVDTGGALVTEYSYGITVRPAQLVQRDKIQAALSTGVVLVQSGETGGSLHASRESVRYKRPLIVVGQSKYDVKVNFEKIMANLVLLDVDESRASKLLKSNVYPVEYIVKMFSKNEYSKVLNTLELERNQILNNSKNTKNNVVDFEF